MDFFCTREEGLGVANEVPFFKEDNKYLHPAVCEISRDAHMHTISNTDLGNTQGCAKTASPELLLTQI